MKKFIFPIIMVLVFGLTACNNNSAKQTDTTELSSQEVSEVKYFTLDELKEFDGKDGKPAYVAVNGIVYDVTDVKAWAGGTHNSNQAGNDLTDAILNKSPHGTRVLDSLEKVGEIRE